MIYNAIINGSKNLFDKIFVKYNQFGYKLITKVKYLYEFYMIL